jgi:hypothetical protein
MITLRLGMEELDNSHGVVTEIGCMELTLKWHSDREETYLDEGCFVYPISNPPLEQDFAGVGGG